MTGKSLIQSGVVVRGDFAKVSIGRYVDIQEDVVLRPACKVLDSGLAFLPLRIGDYTKIGKGSVVQACAIGSSVCIGDHVIVGKRCIVKDGCVIDDHSVLPDDAVLAPFTKIKGVPATIGVDVGEAVVEACQMERIMEYEEFVQQL